MASKIAIISIDKVRGKVKMPDEDLLEKIIRKLEEQDAEKWFENFYVLSQPTSTRYSTEIEDLKIDVASESYYSKNYELLGGEYRIYINGTCMLEGKKVKKLFITISEKVRKYEQQREKEMELRKKEKYYEERQGILSKLKKLL